MKEEINLIAALGRLFAQTCLAAAGWWACQIGSDQDGLSGGVVIITMIYPLATLGLQASVDWQPVKRGPAGLFIEMIELLAILVGMSPLAYVTYQLAENVWQVYEFGTVYSGSNAWVYAWQALTETVSWFQVYVALAIAVSLVLQLQRCAQAAPEPAPIKEVVPMQTHHYCLLHLAIAIGAWGLCFARAVDAEVGWTLAETRTGVWSLVALLVWIGVVLWQRLCQPQTESQTDRAVQGALAQT